MYLKMVANAEVGKKPWVLLAMKSAVLLSNWMARPAKAVSVTVLSFELIVATFA
jgi:hypothetical protein